MNNIPKIILVIDSTRAFGRRFLLGITKYSRLHGPWAFYCEPGDSQSNLPKLRGVDADGMILYETSVISELLSLKKPSVLILHTPNNYPGYSGIKTDSESISKMAAEHLLSRGLRNFAFCGFEDMAWSVERSTFFQEFLEEQGFTVSTYAESQCYSKKKWELEQKTMAEWLTKLPKPIGIMACNDDRGHHVIEACKIAQLKIPEDVSVIGVDNDDLICDLCDPPLTSVVLDTESAGYEAARMLDEKLKNQNEKNHVLIISPSHVKVRNSTDVIATQDKELIKALNFIKQNFRRNIQVEDVVDSTTISRRSLELRFREKLKRSINEEIRRIRIEHISQLLVETKMSISEIAYGLGFSSVEHISRYFQREIGKSPREFRKIKSIK